MTHLMAGWEADLSAFLAFLCALITSLFLRTMAGSCLRCSGRVGFEGQRWLPPPAACTRDSKGDRTGSRRQEKTKRLPKLRPKACEKAPTPTTNSVCDCITITDLLQYIFKSHTLQKAARLANPPPTYNSTSHFHLAKHIDK